VALNFNERLESMLLPIIQDFNKKKTSLKKKMADTDQKKRDRKRNFTEPEINVIQDEVEKKFSLLNDKFSTSIWLHSFV
jgi:hypothetical protein